MINLLQTTYLDPGIVSAESSLCATIHWGSACVFRYVHTPHHTTQTPTHYTNNSLTVNTSVDCDCNPANVFAQKNQPQPNKTALRQSHTRLQFIKTPPNQPQPEPKHKHWKDTPKLKHNRTKMHHATEITATHTRLQTKLNKAKHTLVSLAAWVLAAPTNSTNELSTFPNS